MAMLARAGLRWLLLLALLVTPLAHATIVYCVSDATGLQLALKTYTQQPGDDIQIKMVQGTYLYTGLADTTGYFDSAGSPYQLSLLGGYTAGCAAGSRVINAANTIVDGQNVVGVGIGINAHNNVLLEGLTFTHMNRGVAPQFDIFQNNDLDTITVRFCAFRNNTLRDGDDALYMVGLDNTSAVIHDNVFANNSQPVHTGTFRYAALLILGNDASTSYIVNNTFTNNGANLVRMALVQNQGSGQIYYVYNNIVWNNYLQDILVVDGTAGSTAIVLSNNLYSAYAGLAPVFSQSNKVGAAFDPNFLNPGAADYHLANSSPAVNAGASAVPGYGYPAQDNDGGSRVIGSRVDMGAFESGVDDVTNLVVFTNADNNSNVTPTVGSVRWAIKQANAAASASTITFSTPCLTIFNLPSALPDITTDVTIDGYHNAAGALANGAVPNSSIGGFNAVICQFLDGQGTVANAFRTSGSGRLTVTGMGLAGFTDAAIKLQSGGGHFIAGNQIGAIPLVPVNHDGIRITSTATGAVIGGGLLQDYNWIADSSNVGVYIDNPAGNVSVHGNVIGLGASGTTSAGNGYGVYVGNSPQNNISANLIGDNLYDGVTLSGIASLSNVVANNYIGVDVTLGNQGNGGIGVLLSAGAANNTIGAAQSATTGGNFIAYNAAQGVWVSGGGVGNRVLGDTIFSNAALSIDLGTSGPTANDASPDSDVGANDLQNFPILTGANRSATTVMIVGDIDSSANDSFRLDFYRSLSCRNFGGVTRGDARNYLGRGSVLTDATGHGHFSVMLATGAAAMGVLSATATATNGDTSEMSPCVIETDTIFKDGFE